MCVCIKPTSRSYSWMYTVSGGVALAVHPPADGGVGLPHDDAAARRQQQAERAAHERAGEPGADDEDARGRGVGHRTIKSTPGAGRNDASRALLP